MKLFAKRTMSLLLAALMVLSLIPVMPHVHAEGEEPVTYGAKWQYMVTKKDETTGETIEDYAWLNGVFKTADEDFIYGTSYDWSVTMSPTKGAASVTVEAIIVQEDPAAEGGATEVARVTKDVNVSKAPSTTTLLTHAEVAEQMAGKTGNFLLTLTTYWENPATSNTDAIAQLKTFFAYTGNASDDTVVEEPAPELGEKWEFAGTYGTWMVGAFETEATEFTYKKGEAYDWVITIQQNRANVSVVVDTVVKDAAGKTVASLLNQTVTSGRGKYPMVSASDLPDLDGELLGIFTVECTIKYNGSPAAKATVRYSRTGAASGFDNNPDAAISVQHKTGNEWIGAAFQYGEEDLIYEEDKPYDWALTISPANAVTSDVTVVASIVDANGKTVSSLEKTVAAADITRAPTTTSMVDFREFAELTRELAGTFTLKCDLKIGETVYVRASAKFARTPMVLSDGWEPTANYGWVDVTAHSADADWVFENTQAYDFKVGIKQQRVAGEILNLHAMIKDAQGSLVTELTKEVELVSSAVDYQVILEASELTALTTGIVGDFVLVCEITYGDKPVGRYTKNFSRTCNHAGTVDIPGYPATCTDYGQTTGKKCANCGFVTLAQDVIEPLGHDIVVLSERVEPTCKTEGKSAHHKCSRCDYEKGNNVLPKLTEHVPGAAATCLAPQTCIHCPEVIITPAKNHNYSVVDGKCINGCGKTACENGEHTAGDAATCLAAQTCTKCGTELAKQKEHSFTGEGGKCVNGCGKTQQEICAHAKVDVIPGKAATCTEPGLTDGKKCSDCGAVTVAQEPIPVKAHDYSGEGGKCVNGCGKTQQQACAHAKVDVIPGKAATCTETGLTEGKKCSDCGTVIVAQETIPALDHKMTETAAAVAATCDKAGKTAVLTCANGCGKTEGGAEIAALGHNYVDGTCANCGDVQNTSCEHIVVEFIPAKAATCTEAGRTEGAICKGCGKIDAGKEIPALGHDMKETAAAVAATCDKAGKTAVLTCANGCGKTEGGAEIAALGHKMTETTAAVAATCDKAGKTAVLTCANGCGKTEGGEKIAALGHKEETVAGKDATCTETGLTEGKKCATCGKVTVEQTTIPAKGHNFVDGVCSACGAKEEKPEQPVVSGDADGNGKVNLRDAILVLKAINGGDALDPAIADVDGNGKVNLRDAILTLQLANGKEINK